jgi:hypothetical protein
LQEVSSQKPLEAKPPTLVTQIKFQSEEELKKNKRIKKEQKKAEQKKAKQKNTGVVKF